MSDQCRHCTEYGNYESCMKADCSRHEDWHAVEMQKRIAELEREVKVLEDRHCKLMVAVGGLLRNIPWEIGDRHFDQDTDFIVELFDNIQKLRDTVHCITHYRTLAEQEVDGGNEK